jgi:hypothetical protein
MRSHWLQLARLAVENPSFARPVAALLKDQMRAAAANGGDVPAGYIYHGSRHWIAQVEDLPVEPLPPDNGAVKITDTGNEGIPIRVPYDSLILGVMGWAFPDLFANGDEEGGPGVSQFAPCAQDGRDLFSVDWGLDGQVNFTTDGNRRLMAPASLTVGTRQRPRPMAWTLRRNQNILVRFRNLMNVKYCGSSTADPPTLPPDFVQPKLKKAAIAFVVLNLGAP